MFSVLSSQRRGLGSARICLRCFVERDERNMGSPQRTCCFPLFLKQIVNSKGIINLLF